MKIKQLLLLFVVMLQITSIKTIAHENYESNIAESIPRGDEVFTTAAQMPSFPGGEKALYEYCGRNMRYPQRAADNNIQGQVVVKFVIEKDGRIGEIQIVRGADKNLDNEAMRVCKSLPKFSPGRNENGDPVRVWYTLPFTFTLTENENISNDSDDLVAESTSHKKPSYSSYLRDEYNPLKGGSLSKGIDYYLAELKNDDPEAMFHIARFAADGIGGVQKDPDMAFQLAEKLAEIGNEDGIALLGRCYAEGIGVEKNKIKAMQLLTQVKNNPYAKAYFEFLNGNGWIGYHAIWSYDGYIYYKAAETFLKDLHLTRAFQYYCLAWVMGYEEAGQKAMELRFAGRNSTSSVMKIITEHPEYKYAEQHKILKKKYQKEINKVNQLDMGSQIITDLAGNPLYCTSIYNYKYGPGEDDNMRYEEICFDDEHYALRYSKGKWVDVPVDEDYKRTIWYDINKIIRYEFTDKDETIYLLSEREIKLNELLNWLPIGQNGLELNCTFRDHPFYANLVESTILLEFQHYKDVAIQDSRYCIGGHLGTDVDSSLLKAQTEAGIEEAIEIYEHRMLH